MESFNTPAGARLFVATCVFVVVWTSTIVKADAGPIPADDGASWTTDSTGRTLRVGFPRHARLYLEGGGWLETPADLSGAALSLGAGWRTEWDLDYPDEEIWWRLRTRWLETKLVPNDGRAGLQLISGEYLRHDRSSFVVVPSERNYRFPAPFDIHVSYAVGGVTVAPEVAGRRAVRLDPANTAVLMDFIRDPHYRHRLAVGVAASYTVSPVAGLPDTFEHGFTPFTAGRAVYELESASGRSGLSLQVQCGRSVTVVERRGAWRSECGASGDVELTPLALNDTPLSLVASGSLHNREGWSAALALRWSLPTR